MSDEKPILSEQPPPSLEEYLAATSWKKHAAAGVCLIVSPWVVVPLIVGAKVPGALSGMVAFTQIMGPAVGIAALGFAGLAWRFRNHPSGNS